MPNSLENQDEKIILKIGKVGILVRGGQVYIENFHNQSEQKQSRDSGEKSLLKKVREEVHGRLEQSLRSNFVTLNKESQPRQVQRPWDNDIKLGIKSGELLPQQTTILDVFNRKDVGGKLLILGNPGSGKTTTQIELAKEWIAHHAEKDTECPIPVLIDLSSWRKGSIQGWIEEALNSKYKISVSTSAHWIQKRRIFLLLDGLDELEAKLQEPCIKAINQFLCSEISPEYLVVCCRSEMYEHFRSRLQLNAAVRLGPMSPSQIKRYLFDAGQQKLWLSISHDSYLLTVLGNPLMLSVVSVIYPEISYAELKKTEYGETVPDFLWDAYIDKLLLSSDFASDNQTDLSEKITFRKNSLRWLVWLAQILERDATTEFLIENLQPTYLSATLQRLYRQRLRIMKGIAGGLLFLLLGGLARHVLEDLNIQVFMILAGFIFGAIGASSSKNQMKVLISEAIEWSWARACLGLCAGLTIFFCGQMIANMVGLSNIALIRTGLSTAVIAGLLIGIEASEIEEKNFPNQGIWNTVKISLLKMLGFGIVVGIVSGIYFYQTFSAAISIMASFSVGMGVSLIWMLFDISFPTKGQGSTENCAKHFLLRSVVTKYNLAPWNYADFLSYASKRVVIQRVGGRYRFIHKQLQEHLAAMQVDSL